MANRILLLLSLGVFWRTLPAQQPASECVYFKKGCKLEYAAVDKKGAPLVMLTQTVLEVHQAGDTLVASVESRLQLERGLPPAIFRAKWHAGTLYLDNRNLGQTDPSGIRKTVVTGTDLIFPAGMSPGQSLPDSEMNTRIYRGDSLLHETRQRVYNRRVLALESLTTPAGTFDCVKIGYEQTVNEMRTSMTCWFSPVVGVFRTVTYDAQGRAVSGLELTKVL